MSLDNIWKMLKEKLIEYLVVTISGLSGFKAWVIRKMLSKLLDDYIKPAISWLERKGIVWKKKIEIKKEIKDIENAKPSDVDGRIDHIP